MSSHLPSPSHDDDDFAKITLSPSTRAIHGTFAIEAVVSATNDLAPPQPAVPAPEFQLATAEADAVALISVTKDEPSAAREAPVSDREVPDREGAECDHTEPVVVVEDRLSSVPSEAQTVQDASLGNESVELTQDEPLPLVSDLPPIETPTSPPSLPATLEPVAENADQLSHLMDNPPTFDSTTDTLLTNPAFPPTPPHESSTLEWNEISLTDTDPSPSSLRADSETLPTLAHQHQDSHATLVDPDHHSESIQSAFAEAMALEEGDDDSGDISTVAVSKPLVIPAASAMEEEEDDSGDITSTPLASAHPPRPTTFLDPLPEFDPELDISALGFNPISIPAPRDDVTPLDDAFSYPLEEEEVHLKSPAIVLEPTYFTPGGDGAGGEEEAMEEVVLDDEEGGDISAATLSSRGVETVVDEVDALPQVSVVLGQGSLEEGAGMGVREEQVSGSSVDESKLNPGLRANAGVVEFDNERMLLMSKAMDMMDAVAELIVKIDTTKKECAQIEDQTLMLKEVIENMMRKGVGAAGSI
ncbi:hypothetical protein HDU98_002311 [Podochytrium sp. JEL0797]|nr:hypothetical protein HDU98_002311 [Podochytrium sp. JEL0797]